VAEQQAAAWSTFQPRSAAQKSASRARAPPGPSSAGLCRRRHGVYKARPRSSPPHRIIPLRRISVRPATPSLLRLPRLLLSSSTSAAPHVSSAVRISTHTQRDPGARIGWPAAERQRSNEQQGCGEQLCAVNTVSAAMLNVRSSALLSRRRTAPSSTMSLPTSGRTLTM